MDCFSLFDGPDLSENRQGFQKYQQDTTLSDLPSHRSHFKRLISGIEQLVNDLSAEK